MSIAPQAEPPVVATLAAAPAFAPSLKLPRSTQRRHGSGGFGIEILYPGLARGSDDTGIGTIGRIDHAQVRPGTLIAMHPHRDDEILTYLRSGRVRHRDSEGHTREISNQRLMLMNAGRRFEHEEMVQEGGDLTGLQIFLRPAAGGLEPLVQFRDLDVAYSADHWRLLAGPDKTDGLVVRSQSWVHDMRLTAGRQADLPVSPGAAVTRLLYVLAGRLVVGGEALEAGDSLLVGTAPNRIEADTTADLVLFSTDETAPVFAGGMFSGNMNA